MLSTNSSCFEAWMCTIAIEANAHAKTLSYLSNPSHSLSFFLFHDNATPSKPWLQDILQAEQMRFAAPILPLNPSPKMPFKPPCDFAVHLQTSPTPNSLYPNSQTFAPPFHLRLGGSSFAPPLTMSSRPHWWSRSLPIISRP